MSKGGDERRTVSSTAYTSDIRCPFFRSHSKAEIRCEAVVDRCTTAMLFERQEDKLWWQKTYCEEHCECCEQHQILMESKYSD